MSVFYKPSKSSDRYTAEDVTILIPVYNEDETIFRNVIDSVSRQGSEFIVFGDSCDEPFRHITEENGGKFVHVIKHTGKRGIMSIAIDYVKTPFVMFVDSDTILPDNAEKDMMLYFSENVGGVGSNITIYNNGKGVSSSSEFVERVREVLFKALSRSGSVMVLDGRCVIYKTEIVKPFLTSVEFTDNRILGKKSVLGDDRQITSYILHSGYKAVKDY
ncbi:MAG: glycosyltransferase, partial [Thermoplasmata archaeon]